MKKLITALLCTTFLLTGCSDSKKEVTLKTKEEYKVEDALALTLLNVSTEKQIIVHNTRGDNFDYHYTTDKDETFLDIQLKVKNLSKETINLEKELLLDLKVNDKPLHESRITYLLEQEPYDIFNATSKLKSNNEGILHLAGLIKEKDIDSTITCTFTYQNTVFTIDMKKNLNKNIIKREDKISSKALDIVIEDSYMYPTIDPDNTNGEYEYYETDDPNNFFIITSTTITNNSAQTLTIDTIPDTLFVIDGDYQSPYPYQQNEAGTGFDDDIHIPAKSSKKIYYGLEVQPEIAGKEFYYQVRLDGSTYTLNVQES